MTSFRHKDGSDEPPSSGGGRNVEADFRGRRRSNETHASTTEPNARLYCMGTSKEAKLSFMGHALMENRFGLLVGAYLTRADGHAERTVALALDRAARRPPRAITLGADKGYDAADFVNELRATRVTPTWPGTRAAAARPSTGARHGSGLCCEPADQEAHRGGVQSDEDGSGQGKTRFDGWSGLALASRLWPRPTT